MAADQRCRDDFELPGSPLSVSCKRWKGHDGLHRTALEDDGDGTLFGIEWGSKPR